MTAKIPDEVRALWPPFYMALTLAGGMSSGFVGVTLGYVLTHHGFSVTAVAGLISLHAFPMAWRFLMGPMVDLSLTPRRWYVHVHRGAGGGHRRLRHSCRCRSVPAGHGRPVPSHRGVGRQRSSSWPGGRGHGAHHPGGAAAQPSVGWSQAGGLKAGAGLGGGLGLWIAVHAGGLPAAALRAGGPDHRHRACRSPCCCASRRGRPTRISVAR